MKEKSENLRHEGDVQSSVINDNDPIFFMKIFIKIRIITKRSVKSVMNERKFLSTLKHPFLVNMIFAF